MIAFLLADGDLTGLEVDVPNFRAEHFAPSGTDVSGKYDHRIDEGLGGLILNVCQKFIDFWHGQKQGVPQLGFLGVAQAAVRDLAFDLGPRLERWFLQSLRKLHALQRERGLQHAGVPGPVPCGSKRHQFLLDGGRTERPSAPAGGQCPGIDEPLQVGGAEAGDNDPIAEHAPQVAM